MVTDDRSDFHAMPALSRRAFLGALAASVVAAGVALPVGVGASNYLTDLPDFVADKYIRALALSYRRTKERHAANAFNRIFITGGVLR